MRNFKHQNVLWRSHNKGQGPVVLAVETDGVLLGFVFLFSSCLTYTEILPPRTVKLLTLLHSERPKLYTILAFLSAIELN